MAMKDVSSGRWVWLCLVVAGCPDETAGVGDESSSTGDPMMPTSTSSDPSLTTTTSATTSATTSETAGSSSSTSDDPDTSGSSETTAGAMPTGHARFFVRERTGEGSLTQAVYREYAEGALSDPIALVADLPVDASVTIGGIEPGGEHLAYCISGDVKARGCYVRDVAAFPDGDTQALVVAPVPPDAIMSMPQWIDEWGAYYFTAGAQPPSTERGVYRATVVDGAVATPELLLGSIGDAIPVDTVLSFDRAWISFIANSQADGATDAFVIPTDAADPTAWIEVSDDDDPEHDVVIGTRLRGSEGLVYAVDDTPDALDGYAAYYLVDLRELPLVGTPARVDAPAVDGTRVRGERAAPDDHALVYWVGGGDALLGEIMLVALDDLVPQLPVRISTHADGEAIRIDYDWSPDARWVVYYGAPDRDADRQIYFVDASGAMPGEPHAVLDAPAEQFGSIGFDDETRWFYFAADVGDGASIMRVDVSGAMPGAPQIVAAPPTPNDWVTGEAIWSSDGAVLLYTLEDVTEEARQLWLVDVSGEDAGTPTRIDTLRGSPGVNYGARLSPDDTIVTFSENGVDPGDPQPLWLVDRSAPDQALRIGDDALSAVFLPN